MANKIEGPIVLLILDGVGSYKPYKGNAVSLGNTPFLQQAWDLYPKTLLMASAEYVGLPPMVKGNSEVGHTNIGAGRLVLQDLPRIDKSIREGTFYSNQVLLDSLKHVQKTNGNIHIIGCLSEGRVHSSVSHLKALLEFYHQNIPDKEIYVHAFTDGRDSPPKSASVYFKDVEDFAKAQNIKFKWASVIGRLYAMDRNFTWRYTELAYNLLVYGKGTQVNSWQKALEISYKNNKTDEFLMPYIILDENKQIHTIKDGDVVINYNFRQDRAIQITEAFVKPDFFGFDRGKKLQDLMYISMTRYSKEFVGLVHELFKPNYVHLPLGQVLAFNGKRQLRIAESQKYPHVTYFFDGGVNTLYPGEDRVEIPSPDLPRFDLKPEMSIYEVTRTFQQKLASGLYDFVVMNFANGDMVGHSGNLEASIKAMEHVDKCVQIVAKEVLRRNGALIITADHGNVEEVINQKTGGPDTEHSIYPVPFILVTKDARPQWLKMGRLADIAPTILALFGLEAPSEYTGRVLI